MAVSKRFLWISTTISLIAFLPSMLFAFEAFATLPYASRSDFGKLVIIAAALAPPITCLAAPAFAWNKFDHGVRGIVIFAAFAPAAMLLVLAVALLVH